MSLRERLTLSIITILVLFSINVGTDSWSHQKRSSSMDKLRLAVSSQLEIANIREKTTDLHKAVILLSSLRTTLGESLTGPEIGQGLREINQLRDDIDSLGSASAQLEQESLTQLLDDFGALLNSWGTFYRQYNTPIYDHFAESERREILYNDILQQLKTIEEDSIKIADQEALDIDTIEALTNRITISVFITSIILTIGLGVFLIRYTNQALSELKNGTIIIGQGDFDHRIPVTTQDELGEVAEAFNDMASKMQFAMEEIKQARDTANQANQSKSRFLANMSHELRTPLNAIIGYSEMLMEDIENGLSSPKTQQQDLEKILAAGKNLLSHINDVLDFSKIETGKMTVHKEWFDPANALLEVIETVTPLAKTNQNTLQHSISSELPEIYNDITKFKQIFFNLLSNASKFTQQGNITVDCSTSDNAQGKLVKIMVSDTGIGMTVDQLLVVFDAFVQADSSTTRRYGGTGLGLALCKQYCELMGGEIEVASVVNRGTSFTVSFPIQEA